MAAERAATRRTHFGQCVGYRTDKDENVFIFWEGNGVGPMCNLVFRCPECSADIPSGIDVDDQTLKMIGRYPIGLTCALCDSTSAFPLRLGHRDEADRLALAWERAPPLVPGVGIH